MTMNTYTIEMTEWELTQVLAEMNMARMDSIEKGFDASARSNERLAYHLIQQALSQGYDGGDETEYGGETVEADA